MKKIIVIGSVHHNTLGTIRCIGMAEYKCDLILIGQDGYVSKSKYIDKKYIIKNESEVVNLIKDVYGNEKEKPIILTCTDGAQHVLDENYDNLINNFEFFNCGANGRISYYMDKQVQCGLAKSVCLNIPFTYVNQSSDSEIPFPCLIKPLQSINGGKQIIRCNNISEFKRGISCFDSNTAILVQQYIEKEKEVVILGCATKNDIHIPGYILKHRDHQGGTLYSTVCSIKHLPAVLIDRCKDLLKAIRYEGLFGIEFIYSRGIYYFIEINLRTDATTFALACAGANLPQSYINFKVNGYFRPARINRSISSIVDYNDFRHRKDHQISLKSWMKQYLSSECKYYWNKKDPMPFIFAPINLILNHK